MEVSNKKFVMVLDIIKVYKMATYRRKTCPEKIITDNIIK